MATDSCKRSDGSRMTAIVTGGASGIGAQTIRTFYERGCNVVIADLPQAENTATNLIESLSDRSRALYHPTNITDWSNMTSLFRAAKERFGQIDIVVANAGMMESKGFFDFEEDENGDLKESEYAQRVLDVNLRGTANTLRLAMHSMSKNPQDTFNARGSIILIASTSGYFGGTGVVSYIASKHGVVGLARASQRVANQLDVRVNVVAPFFTPTHITGSYSDKWKERGLPANTVEDVAEVVVSTAFDSERKGHSVMVAGKIVKEVEVARNGFVKEWLGEDITHIMTEGGKFFDDMGGYPLPKSRI